MLLKSTLCAGLFLGLMLLIQEPSTSETKQEPQAGDQAAAPAVSLEGVKCVLMGDAGASAEFSAPYRDGVVYFGSADCKATFEKDSSAYATQANHQLVLTGQYEQKLCPISGHEFTGDHRVNVMGIEIGLCCENCLASVNGEKDPAKQAAMVFANEVFEKCFACKQAAISIEGLKCFLMPKKDVNAEKVVEYNGGKVFFCCDGCVKRFSKDPSKFAAKANEQLVQTGQFHQTACPLGGEPVDPEQSVDVGGVKVSFCCGKCRGAVAGAEGAKQTEMVFGADAFARGFSRK